MFTALVFDKSATSMHLISLDYLPDFGPHWTVTDAGVTDEYSPA